MIVSNSAIPQRNERQNRRLPRNYASTRSNRMHVRTNSEAIIFSPHMHYGTQVHTEIMHTHIHSHACTPMGMHEHTQRRTHIHTNTYTNTHTFMHAHVLFQKKAKTERKKQRQRERETDINWLIQSIRKQGGTCLLADCKAIPLNSLILSTVFWTHPV